MRTIFSLTILPLIGFMALLFYVNLPLWCATPEVGWNYIVEPLCSNGLHSSNGGVGIRQHIEQMSFSEIFMWITGITSLLCFLLVVLFPIED